MQIICNNCGNDLTFPNEQHLVTCSHCLTTMEIEESEYIFIAKTVEKPIVDDSIFQESNELMEVQSVDILYDLLKLEEEYDNAIEKYFSQRIISGNNFRPTLSRSLFQIVVGILTILYFIDSVSNMLKQDFSVLLILVLGIYFIQSGIKEGIKWWKFKQVERHYFEEQRYLVDLITPLKLPNHVVNSYANYKDNLDYHLDIRNKYFHIKILKRKINIGASTIAKAFQTMILGFVIIFLLIDFQPLSRFLFHYGLKGVYLISFYLFCIGNIYLFFIILAKKRRYRKTYLENLDNRDDMIHFLKEALNQ